MSLCYSVRMTTREERLLEEVAELRAILDHPAVKAVVELVREAERQFNRAETAHDAKDEANRRWLDEVTRKDCEDVCHPSHGACCGGRPGVKL